MTDKQIIIHRVDVSKCSHFNFTDEHYCNECSSEFGCATCDERPDCYYKQLKRTEQKLDKIKKVCNKFTPEYYKILLIINDGMIKE